MPVMHHTKLERARWMLWIVELLPSVNIVTDRMWLVYMWFGLNSNSVCERERLDIVQWIQAQIH